MQPIQEVNEQSEVGSKEKKLKDASTNTIGGILRYGASADGYTPTSNLYINPPRTDHPTTPTSPFSCPNFQGNILFQPTTPTAPPLPTQPSIEASLLNHANNCDNVQESLPHYLQPLWNAEVDSYRRHFLRRSPVTYDIKMLSSEGGISEKRDQFNRGSTKSHSSSNISFLPYQTLFDSEREFHATYHSGLRSNLDSRFSSSEGSLASSLSRSENNRYIVPHSRVVDLLDLQTVICDPVLHNQNASNNKNDDGSNSKR